MNPAALPVIFLLVRTLVEGVGRSFGSRVKQGLAVAVSAVLVYAYNINILAGVGLHTKIAPVDFAINVALVALGSMSTHDLLDALAGKR